MLIDVNFHSAYLPYQRGRRASYRQDQLASAPTWLPLMYQTGHDWLDNAFHGTSEQLRKCVGHMAPTDLVPQHQLPEVHPSSCLLVGLASAYSQHEQNVWILTVFIWCWHLLDIDLSSSQPVHRQEKTVSTCVPSSAPSFNISPLKPWWQPASFRSHSRGKDRKLHRYCVGSSSTDFC